MGQKVKPEDLLALSGNVGYSDGQHLHFSVSIPLNGKKIKTIPVKFMTEPGKAKILHEGKYYTAR